MCKRLSARIAVPSRVLAAATLEEKAEAVGCKTRKIIGGLKKGFSTEGEKRAQLTVEISDAMQKNGIVLNSARKATFEPGFPENHNEVFPKLQ